MVACCTHPSARTLFFFLLTIHLGDRPMSVFNARLILFSICIPSHGMNNESPSLTLHRVIGKIQRDLCVNQQVFFRGQSLIGWCPSSRCNNSPEPVPALGNCFPISRPTRWHPVSPAGSSVGGFHPKKGVLRPVPGSPRRGSL